MLLFDAVKGESFVNHRDSFRSLPDTVETNV